MIIEKIFSLQNKKRDKKILFSAAKKRKANQQPKSEKKIITFLTKSDIKKVLETPLNQRFQQVFKSEKWYNRGREILSKSIKKGGFQMENRHDFEPDFLLTEDEWKKKGYKLITGAKFDKFVKDEDGTYRYDCNAVCRLKPAKTAELTENQWLKEGYAPKEGAFGREMHYYSRDGIFIYTKDEVEKDEAKVKAILEEKRKRRNERQRQNRIDRKERKQELEQELAERKEELKELRKSFPEKQETFVKLTEQIRNKEYDIVEVAFDRYRSYDFIADKELNEYVAGEKIDIPRYEEAIIVDTRKGTLKYEVEYPYSFDFLHDYRKTNATYIKLEDYANTEEAKAFEEQRHKDYKRYNWLKEWCEGAEEKLLFGQY